jgi:hypothetical protein
MAAVVCELRLTFNPKIYSQILSPMSLYMVNWDARVVFLNYQSSGWNWFCRCWLEFSISGVAQLWRHGYTALKKFSTASVIYAWAFFTVLHSLGGDNWPCNDAASVTNSSWNSESRLDSVEGCGCSDEGAAGNCTGHETKIRLVWVRVCMHNFHKQTNLNSRPDTCSKFWNDDDDLCIHISWLPLSLDHTCFML